MRAQRCSLSLGPSASLSATLSGAFIRVSFYILPFRAFNTAEPISALLRFTNPKISGGSEIVFCVPSSLTQYTSGYPMIGIGNESCQSYEWPQWPHFVNTCNQRALCCTYTSHILMDDRS